MPSSSQAPRTGPAPTHAVLLPVKPPARGKSRLVGLADEARTALARAFALDTAEACLTAGGVGAVLVATDDAFFASEVRRLGCAVIPDGVSGDLNGALVQAAAEAHRRWPELVPVALCGDLPALRPADLEEALASVTPGTAAYVVDAVGTGTTLYTAAYDGFAPRFGPDSARLHHEGGALALDGVLETLRHDVDTLDDLRAVKAYGLGPRTLLAALQAGVAL
ncbi:2-phospho-L-lactate guanylyltransferase [Nocardioides sp. KR10-350]|uniref:2-phospho-L-lactate guanylyltransferase n=1 Tax=Nocardioides cheoyonin TaxID=3156615 RepID=UPI0032B56813